MRLGPLAGQGERQRRLSRRWLDVRWWKAAAQQRFLVGGGGRWPTAAGEGTCSTREPKGK
jgi:hypothetical protein